MCVYIITLSTNNCKMYLLDSLKNKIKIKKYQRLVCSMLNM